MKVVTKLFILIDLIVAACFLMVYGPIEDAKVFWIATAMETGNHKYLANIFYSEDAIDKVIKENYFIAVDEETNVNDIVIGETEQVTTYASVYEKQILDREKDDLYKLIEFKYEEFNCYLVAIYDPTRVHAVSNEKINHGKILTEISEANDAIVAINGGGYSWSTGYPVGVIVQNGELKYERSVSGYSSAGINDDGVLILGNFNKNSIKEQNIKEALSFKPALIVNGKPIQMVGNGGSGRNPRTVIAQRKDGIILFLVVNGYGSKLSWKGRGGVYYKDLVTILQRYGAYNAMNMDGGSSTTMVINGELINDPCEPLKNGQDFIRSAWILK